MSKFASVVSRSVVKAKSFYARALALVLFGWLSVKPAFADLPTVEAPTSSGSGTGLNGQLTGYIQDGLVLGGLVLCSVAFFMVAQNCLVTFNEVRNERATWVKFGSIVVVGVALLVAIIWLLGKSAGIIG
ncbi:TIGR03745 family integrating conjugative element membrane protein [Pantoea rodasii]|uniref:TIGR03745 family integrating conjugative element membrane protein n=1 Tax=Pantoea rodasii TaxID=1076549 RepID=A0A2M9W9I9_9GAMM|nr:TIGR03745 family integrating conjugative element membrane protein [Pantoea rodasii]ORM63899.1 integrating conjugative element membrane protein [Pantoea rodasii]PJZ04201.1 TIGR03745 family integrating conjugative element membrane protein [Pantoea rodasii]